MNPLPMLVADLRSLGRLAWAILLVIALAVAIGIGVTAQERMLRAGSARAADDFDLVIGAAGAPTQLVLTSVYLQPDALPLLDGAILNRLARDARVAAVAPLAFGDVVRGYPVVGTTAGFASRWGRIAPAEGRRFEREGEAVVGADVRLSIARRSRPRTRRPARIAPVKRTRMKPAIATRARATRSWVVCPVSARPGTGPCSSRSRPCGPRTASAAGMGRATPPWGRRSMPRTCPGSRPSWSRTEGRE